MSPCGLYSIHLIRTYVYFYFWASFLLFVWSLSTKAMFQLSVVCVCRLELSLRSWDRA